MVIKINFIPLPENRRGGNISHLIQEDSRARQRHGQKKKKENGKQTFLLNLGAKILNRILPSILIHKNIYHEQLGFIPGMQD